LHTLQNWNIGDELLNPTLNNLGNSFQLYFSDINERFELVGAKEWTEANASLENMQKLAKGAILSNSLLTATAIADRHLSEVVFVIIIEDMLSASGADGGLNLFQTSTTGTQKS
jgi:hypothetical protein